MRRSVAVLLLIAVVCSFAFAEYYEKVKSYQIGPGTIYSYYEENTHPWAIHVTEVDLSNPYIKLETVKAGDQKLGREGTSRMSSRVDAPGHRVVSAINGDFYNTTNGQPINNQVVNGEFVQGFTYHRSAFTYSEGGIAGITIPTFSGELFARDSGATMMSHNINVVNLTRYTNYIVIYNSFQGATTGTNEWGYDCVARAISDWVVNDTVYAVIESRMDGVNNPTIPSGKFIISGHGSGENFLKEYCLVGDTVRIVQRLANSPKRLTQLVGGGPWMLRNGVDVTASNTEGIGSDFYAVRHPRTAVGLNSDSTKAYFMVVDGRNPHSAGMTCHEQAAFLKSIGASHAINLDGGGSTTFTVRSDIMNIPSDGWERIVANALMCVSSAPDSDLAIVQIERDSIAVYKNNTFDLPMSGWDIYYNPKDIPAGSGLQVEHTAGLGTYSDGEFTVSDLDMDGNIYTDLNGVRDTMAVHIISIDSLNSYPQHVVTDSLKTIPFFVYGKEDSKAMARLENSIFEFEILDESIGTIDDNGVFTPIKSGETQLVVHYGTDSDTSTIQVECASSELILDEIEDLFDWSLSGENLDMGQTVLSLIDRRSGSGGEKCLQVDYVTTDDGIIALSTSDKRVFGVPETYLIDARSDNQRHRLYLIFEDANGIEYKFKSSGFFSGELWETRSISSEAIIPRDGAEYYPMTLKKIYIDLANGIVSGTLYFDFIRTTYPGWTAIEETGEGAIPSEFDLKQNYPNPFNPITAINYQLSAHSDVDLSIYDVNGRKVATLINGSQESGKYTISFDASMLPGGVYFYRLMTEGWSDTKKMLLIK